MGQDRPNLLVIMTDDQGAWALGCAGNQEIRTPNLDRLAAGGIRFDSFFCASPVCSPARASFLTGRIPSQHGVHDWLRGGNTDCDAGYGWSGPDRSIEYLRGLTGFTDLLAAAGYTVGHSGKWHMGASATPQKGASWWYGYALGGGNYYAWDGYDHSPERVHHTEYVTDYYTDRALEFLDGPATEGAPWCLSVHYTAPHSPWGREQHPAEVFDSYDACPFDSVPREPAHPWHGWGLDDQAKRLTQQGYFAAVTAMDTQVGRLLDRLEAQGLREDTLIVFTSDNGFNLGHHGICGKGNGTFPLNMYDTSVKVPFVVSRPGHVPAGVVCDGLWSHYDWLPTVADYFGLSAPADETLPGRSFAEVLRGGPAAGGETVVVYDEYGPVRMIRDRAWKYVHRYPYGPHELYHLAAHPGERTNLVDDPAYAGELVRLRAGLAEWFLRYVDPARDGVHEGVTGQGQMDECGPRGEGRVAWFPRATPTQVGT